MPSIHRVIQYSNLDYFQVLALDFDTFRLMDVNAVVDEYRKTEEGRDYLEKVHRLKQTEPDYKAILDYKKAHTTKGK